MTVGQQAATGAKLDGGLRASVAAPAEPLPPEVPLTEERLEKFLLGETTWAQLVGISMREAYGIAEIGYAMYRQGKLGEAKIVFEALVLSNPGDAYFHDALGTVYRQLGREQEAVEQYGLAIALDPRSMHALVERGELLIESGQLESAVRDLEAAMVLDESGAEASAARARALVSGVRSVLDGVREPVGPGVSPTRG